MRVSLKDLFAGTAFVAAMAWCAAEAGFDNGIFWSVLVVALVLAGLFVLFARMEHGRWLATFPPILSFFFCVLPAGSNVLLVVVGLLLVAGVVCSFGRPRSTRTLVGVAMGCLLAASVFGVVDGRARLAQLQAMREEFPLVTLANRLSYERRRVAPLAPPALSPTVEQSLVHWEQHFDSRNSRTWQLERIHQRHYELFVRAAGFGVGRMVRPYPDRMRLPELRDIPLDMLVVEQPTIQFPGWTAAWQASQWRERNPSVVGPDEEETEGVENLHFISRDDFLDGAGFGWSAAPLEKVAGFVEHGLHYPPVGLMEDRTAWSVERMQLISLLRFDGPRVYVLDHLPRMDQLSSENAPTRELGAFEAAALAKLLTEEDVVVSEEGAQTRMMGSLRAGSQCMDCHSVPRGTLLGAFSYVLRGRDTQDGTVAWNRFASDRGR